MNDKELAIALRVCVDAMKRSVDIGCTDHLDSCRDAGAFWHDAIAAGEAALSRVTFYVTEPDGREVGPFLRT